MPYRIGSAIVREWMARLRDGGFEIGLHPSYLTPEQPERMRREKERLEAASESPITSVRQHYLRHDLVRTGRLHEDLGFVIDSTLGYAEHEGFRRGTCVPFQVYDLEADRALDVWEMPPALMDSALFNRRKLGPGRAVDVTFEMAEACRTYGGVLVGIWHTMLGDEIDCPGWRAHFLRTLDGAREREASISSLADALGSWV